MQSMYLRPPALDGLPSMSKCDYHDPTCPQPTEPEIYQSSDLGIELYDLSG